MVWEAGIMFMIEPNQNTIAAVRNCNCMYCIAITGCKVKIRDRTHQNAVAAVKKVQSHVFALQLLVQIKIRGQNKKQRSKFMKFKFKRKKCNDMLVIFNCICTKLGLQ